MRIDQTDFDRQNRATIAQFLHDAEKNHDDLSGSVIATITQFIMNMRVTICKIGNGRGWVTPIEIIDSQVQELRRCIVDLEAYKGRLEQGVTHQ